MGELENFCKLVGVDHLLDPRHFTWDELRNTTWVFGGIVRQGLCGNGKQFAAGTVSKAFTAIGQAIALAQRDNPFKASPKNSYTR